MDTIKIRIFFAWVCASLFVFSGVTAFLFFNFERKAFSAATYKRAFKEQGLYEYTPMLLTSMLNNADDAPPLFSMLNKDQQELVISSLLPPDELETLTDSVLDSTFTFLNGESDTITISLLSFKHNMVGNNGMEAYTQLMLAQPECTPEQLMQMGLGILSLSNNTILCQPPAALMTLTTPLIETQLQLMTLAFPDELTLVTASDNSATQFRARLDRARALMQITPLPPLLFLLAFTVLAVRSLKDWLKWWGIPFLITGVLAMLIALIGTPFIRTLMEALILQGNAETPAAIAIMLRNTAVSVARQILRPVAIQGFVLTLIGAGMLLWNKYGTTEHANQTVTHQ